MRETEIVLLEERLKNQAAMIESLTRFDEIEYDFDQKNGYYKRIKSQYVYCPRCYHNKRESPMKVLKNGWQCLHPECDYFLENSDYDPFSYVSDARW